MKKAVHILTLCIFILTFKMSWGSKIDMSFEERVRKSPVVIEAKHISKTKSYWRGRMIYTSNIFEVWKVFKGNLTNRYIEIPIEGGQVEDEAVSIPSCGTTSIGTGILFINIPDQKEVQNSPYNSGDTLANHFIVYAIYDALLYDVMYASPPVYFENVENNLYKYIEGLTHEKRIIIQNPEVQDVKIRSWLKGTDQENLSRQHGIKFNFFKSRYTEGKEKYFSYYLWSSPTSGFSDLNQAKIIIHYNTKAFGENVVKNNIARLSAVFLNTKAYEIYLTDYDSSNIALYISLKNKKNGIFQLKNNLVGIEMKISDTNSNTGIYLVNSKCRAKYFDYDKNRISNYAYIFAYDTLDYPISYHFKPVIDNSYPDTLVAERDTLTINGKYLMSQHARIYFSCTKHPCGTGCIIPQEYFIIQTDTLLKLRIPGELATNITACGRTMPVVSGFSIQKEVSSPGTSSPRNVVVVQ